jgi:transcriptional regulator with XRE-family HTH domain
MTRPRNLVGPFVRELRERQELTQAELVVKLNLLGWDLSRDTLAKIEAQIRWVADFEMVKLAAAVGMEAPEFIRRAIAKGYKNPKILPTLLKKQS